jgi:hypothetical protein|tara:strand:- start:10 stop:219 length:210 start_codon:yes stop_codon:yes gene_type:complete
MPIEEKRIKGLFDIYINLKRIANALEHALSCGIPCGTGCQVPDVLKRAEKHTEWLESLKEENEKTSEKK